MLKKVLIILLAITLAGCSSIERKKEIQRLEEKQAEINKMRMIEEGYIRLENYKKDKDYTEYEIKEDYSDESKILKIIRGKNCYKVGEKYQTKGIPSVTRQKIVFYGYGNSKLYICENEEEQWEVYYKVSGFKETIDAVNSFKIRIKDKKTGKEIKNEIGNLTQSRQEYALIPGIKNIYYNDEKISFEQIGFLVDTTVEIRKLFPTRFEKKVVTDDVYKKMRGCNPDYIIELKIVKNNEDVGKIILKDRKNSILYIKNGIDEDLKSFLFKSALLLKLHKEIGNSIQKEFY